MTSILFVIVLMLPGLSACSSGMSRRETTASTYKAPYPEVGTEKKTTTAVTVQPAQ